MFFCLPYAMKPCGMYTVGHLALFLMTALLIGTGLYLCRQMSEERVRTVIRAVTALLWALEIWKIVFVLAVTGSRNPNDFVPLYYCSLVLYAGLFASFGKGALRRFGDVFLATGSLVGGACFLFFPSTSLPRYPFFHLISFQSFLLHGVMVFVGLLMLMRCVYRITLRDIWSCVILVGATGAISYVFNFLWNRAHPSQLIGTNLMFVSNNFTGCPVDLYGFLGPVIYPIFMIAVQAFGPFLLVYWGILLCRLIQEKKSKKTI